MSLTRRDIMRVVNRYIGVSGGYLGDFSYRTHADFYPEYCDLDIDPYQLEGTTRERFMHILGNASTSDQAKILRGVVACFPPEDPPVPKTRTTDLKDELLALAATLDAAPVVPSPTLGADFETTRRHLADAERLIAGDGASRAVDRVHTAIHDYLKQECLKRAVPLTDDPGLTTAFSALRQHHPAFVVTTEWTKEINKVVRRFAQVLEALNELRNNASPAHPNETLDEAEAMLAVNAARTVLHYVHALVQREARRGDDE